MAANVQSVFCRGHFRVCDACTLVVAEFSPRDGVFSKGWRFENRWPKGGILKGGISVHAGQMLAKGWHSAQNATLWQMSQSVCKVVGFRIRFEEKGSAFANGAGG